MTKIHSHILGGAVVLSGLFASQLAQAQDAPAPPPAAPPPAAEAAPAPPPAAAPPPPMEAAPPAAAPMPMPEAPPPPPPADNPFKVTVGAGLRSAIRIQNANDNKKLNDQYMDELNLELRTSGKVTDIIGWTGNFTVDGRTRAQASGGPIAFQAQAMDLVGQLDFMDEFHVWMGRMLTASDRSNFSGPWFMAPWNYSGVQFTGGYFGPRGTEEIGRETGVTVWGDIGKGKFKYYLGLLDLDGNFGVGTKGFASENPLFTARLNYAIVGSEPGFYGSSAYYGGQDIVAIGAAFQYQKDYHLLTSNGVVKDNLVEFNADFLAEKKLEAGTPGIEAAFYHESGDSRSFNNFFYVMPTFTTGEILPAKGKLNALFRFQMAKTGDAVKTTHTMFEPSVAYLFKDYFAKLQLSYVYAKQDTNNLKSNSIQLGFQIQQ
jgi:hypothetical protein